VARALVNKNLLAMVHCEEGGRGEDGRQGCCCFVLDGLDLGRVDFIAWFVDPVIPKDWASKSCGTLTCWMVGVARQTCSV
jgi:hypothetical protein